MSNIELVNNRDKYCLTEFMRSNNFNWIDNSIKYAFTHNNIDEPRVPHIQITDTIVKQK